MTTTRQIGLDISRTASTSTFTAYAIEHENYESHLLLIATRKIGSLVASVAKFNSQARHRIRQIQLDIVFSSGDFKLFLTKSNIKPNGGPMCDNGEPATGNDSRMETPRAHLWVIRRRALGQCVSVSHSDGGSHRKRTHSGSCLVWGIVGVRDFFICSGVFQELFGHSPRTLCVKEDISRTLGGLNLPK